MNCQANFRTRMDANDLTDKLSKWGHRPFHIPWEESESQLGVSQRQRDQSILGALLPDEPDVVIGVTERGDLSEEEVLVEPEVDVHLPVEKIAA